MRALRSALLLTLVYLALTANLQLSNIVVGVVVASIVTFLVRSELGDVLEFRNLPRALWALLRYTIILIRDLIGSGIQVARIVLNPKLPIKPGVVAIDARVSSDLDLALSEHAITVTPGEMVVEDSEEGVMYVHCLDATDAEKYADDAQNMRANLLDQIFD